MDQKQLEPLLRIHTIIQDHYARIGRFDYTIRSSEHVGDQPLDAMRHIQFWVGVGDQGGILSLNEMVALVKMVEDQARQIAQSTPEQRQAGRMEFKVDVNLKPSDEQILAVLKHLKSGEPQPGTPSSQG